MAVVVVLRQLHLTDPLRRAVSIHLDERADLEPPVTRDAIDAREIRRHRALAGQRVAERVEVLEQGLGAEGGLHRAQQGCDEQPRHATVEPVRDAPVVALRELVVEVRVRDRVAEPRQELAVVGADVAVVHGDHPRDVAREHIAKGQPGAATLAASPRVEALGLESLVEGLEPRTAVPEQDRRRSVDGLHTLEQRPHVLVLAALVVHSGDAHDDLAQVVDAPQGVDDAREPRSVELRAQTRQHQSDRVRAAQPEQVVLEPLGVRRPQAMKRGDRPTLVKI